MKVLFFYHFFHFSIFIGKCSILLYYHLPLNSKNIPHCPPQHLQEKKSEKKNEKKEEKKEKENKEKNRKYY